LSGRRIGGEEFSDVHTSSSSQDNCIDSLVGQCVGGIFFEMGQNIMLVLRLTGGVQYFIRGGGG
jgi:hypothetical protein